MNKELIVGNYLFTNIADADQARLEEKKIVQLKEKLRGADIELLYKVYNKSIEARTFKTPIGYEFMCEYKKFLDSNPNTPGEVIPVPLYTTFDHSSDNLMERQIKFEKQEKLRRAEKSKEDKSVVLVLSLFGNAVLVLIVVLMFFILRSGQSPTVLDYKEKLINQYSTWEKELSDREKEIKNAERQLGIEYFDATDNTVE